MAVAAGGKQMRTQPIRSPTFTPRARWQAVQQAAEKELSLSAIALELTIALDTVGKYLNAESLRTKLLSAKAEALAKSLVAAD